MIAAHTQYVVSDTLSHLHQRTVGIILGFIFSIQYYQFLFLAFAHFIRFTYCITQRILRIISHGNGGIGIILLWHDGCLK
ncbi:hypothetical protein B0T39_12885 [Chromobacterium haemolyticum]|nr:hypothetical protein B0T39_12885 [Chromobacterium haemolyticum]